MKDLTKGNPVKVMCSFALPLLIGHLFQLFYGLADTRIVGSCLGDDALTSVYATTTLNDLIVGFLVGITNGFAVKTDGTVIEEALCNVMLAPRSYTRETVAEIS